MVAVVRAVAVAAVVVAVVAAVAVVTGAPHRTPVCASEFVEVSPGYGPTEIPTTNQKTQSHPRRLS